MQENEVKFGEKSEFFQNHGFSIEISEATVRDFDLNPGACESWDLELFHAQGFRLISPTLAPLVAFYLPLDSEKGAGYSALVAMDNNKLGVFYDRNNHTMIIFEAQSVSFTSVDA